MPLLPPFEPDIYLSSYERISSCIKGSSQTLAAHSSASPKTEQLISRRLVIACSASILSVNEAARVIAPSSSSAEFTFVMPTLEPKFTGLIISGKPIFSVISAVTAALSVI